MATSPESIKEALLDALANAFAARKRAVDAKAMADAEIVELYEELGWRDRPTTTGNVWDYKTQRFIPVSEALRLGRL